MRPLTDEETQSMFAKLSKYIGGNIVHLVDNEEDPHVFRLHRARVFYMREAMMKLATSVQRKDLISAGTCIGKFSKTGKFRVHITALHILAVHAKNKLWVKSNGEMPYLYGNHVAKAHVGRISEDIPQHEGVVIFNMRDVPLGFGVTSRTTVDMRRLDPTAHVAFNQADCGEYLRDEDTLF